MRLASASISYDSRRDEDMAVFKGIYDRMMRLSISYASLSRTIQNRFISIQFGFALGYMSCNSGAFNSFEETIFSLSVSLFLC